jgi:hypothetical protein
MPWSSNATLLCSLKLGDRSCRAIYKPGRGERPLWDFPGGLFRREVAAYELSAALGFDVVPETVCRIAAPFGEGSMQRFVEADFGQHYFSLLEDPERGGWLRRIAGFDLLANSADRKGGHLLLDPADGHVWAIDNGLSFHPEPKLRTVMWDFAGEALPAEILGACESIVTEVPAKVAELLAPDEREALTRRAVEVLRSGRFPAPAEERRAYPWPLV